MAPLCSIYGLYSTEDMVVRYIGQTTQTVEYRRKQHLIEAIRPPGTSRCHRWIRKVLRSGYEIGAILLEANCAWNEAEIRWIAKYREEHPDIMTNLSAGGCGFFGKHSEESKRKMRGPKSEEHRRKLLANVYANLLSPEPRRKIALAQIGNTKGRGEKNGEAVLTEKDVIKIHKKLRDKIPISAICKAYGVSKASISKIRTGRTWKHLGLWSNPV
jgi:hypothetical protein